ncbi:MAG: putative transcriptional regulator, CopG/Arc/MetJ family [candidate division NC10 bacterium]|nr:putative transcriptional regulator, CopG/Arc/MetJ family [candidate division NC10 bacterium]
MNVSLTPELAAFVAKKVKSRRYTSASEVVREALRLLEEHEQIRAIQLAEFQSELDRRLDALDRGEHADPLRVRAELRSRSQRRRVSRR